MLDELEAIPPPEPAEPVAGQDDRSSPRPLRRRLIGIACVVATLAAALSWARSALESPPSAGERLRAIQDFVGRATSVRFEASHELASPFTGPAPTYRTEGALRFPGSAWRVSHGGVSPDEESIRIPEGRYVRTARPGRPLREVRWEFIANEQSFRGSTGEDPEVRPDFGELLSGLGPPLDAEPDRADLREVVAALEDPEPAGENSIRARLPLAALFREPRLAGAMLDGTGGVELRLTAGPEGRLDRLVWDLDARRLDAPPGAQCNIGPGPSQYGHAVCVRERADIAFSGWNEPVAVEAPAISSVDLTPGVDEESLAEAPEPLRLAPRTLPEGLVLRWGTYEATGAGDRRACGAVSLSYQALAGSRPGPHPYLLLSIRGGEGCVVYGSIGADRAPRSVSAGPHRVEVYEEPAASLGLARLVVGQAEVQVEWGDLPEAVLLDVLATLGPLDLATQPVYESVPPRY